MAQYKVYDGTDWKDAAIIGPKGDIGPYYKPSLDKDGVLTMTPTDYGEKPEVEILGNITGPKGETGYGYNANLLDNADFVHAIKRTGDTNYICERWYKNDAANLTANLTSTGLELTTKTGVDRSFIKQNFPYISPGKYIISVVSNSSTNTSFSFRIINSGGSAIATVLSDSVQVFEFVQDKISKKYVHYGVVEVPSELLASGAAYPSVQIGNAGTNTIYRAKFETVIYKDGENVFPTIGQDIIQNQSYNKLIAASSDMNGNYTSLFRSNTVSIAKSSWKLQSDGFYYAPTSAVTDATGDCHIIVAAEPNSAAEFADFSIICTGHDTSTGILTFRAVAIPDKTIESNILVVRY